MVKEVTKFYADDGTEFDTRAEAARHDFDAVVKAADRYRDYVMHSYSGTRVVKEHGLEKYGVWEVLGEDSNADLGGSHYQPSLGLFEGTLDQVIRKATSMNSFYTWGGGGSIFLREKPEVLKL